MKMITASAALILCTLVSNVFAQAGADGMTNIGAGAKMSDRDMARCNYEYERVMSRYSLDNTSQRYAIFGLPRLTWAAYSPWGESATFRYGCLTTKALTYGQGAWEIKGKLPMRDTYEAWQAQWLEARAQAELILGDIDRFLRNPSRAGDPGMPAPRTEAEARKMLLAVQTEIKQLDREYPFNSSSAQSRDAEDAKAERIQRINKF